MTDSTQGTLTNRAQVESLFAEWISIAIRLTSNPTQLTGPMAPNYTAIQRTLTMKYKIASQQSDDGYSISVPSLPWVQVAKSDRK